MLPPVTVIFPAAGRSSRFGGREKKPFATIDGRAVWIRTVEQFLSRDEVKQLIVIVAPEDMGSFKEKFGANLMFMGVQAVAGGKERFDSIANALKIVKEDVEMVAVHDAVRPCLTRELIDSVFKAAVDHGAAIPAVEVSDTLKRSVDGVTIDSTVPREKLWQAQTPQVFRKQLLLDAYAKRGEITADITDDAQLVEHFGHKVRIVPGLRSNIKITTRDDLGLADLIIKNKKPEKLKAMRPFEDENMMWR